MIQTTTFDHIELLSAANDIVQVLLVTGGSTSTWYQDSTEFLLPSATSWTIIDSAALPSPRYGLIGATLDNKVLITGTNIDTLVTTHS